jgi:cation:H+ antiporter
MITDILFFIIGLILLYFGAELLVRGSSRLALLARIKPMVIGLTVVAFGTSFPEFITSLVAAWQDKVDLAVGNIVGSNIANICLILGISAILRPIIVEPASVKKEIIWLLSSSVLFLVFGLGGYINRIEGIILLSGIIVFTGLLIHSSARERRSNQADESLSSESSRFKNMPVPLRLAIYSIMTILGIMLLVYGSKWLIISATNIARLLGVSEIIIGLSLVAFGTSLPELATAVISVVRKENEILIGNILGSNIFNLLFVGGGLSTFFQVPINSRVVTVDLPAMMGISLMLIPIVFWQKAISRMGGFFLLMVYIAYISFIFLNQ